MAKKYIDADALITFANNHIAGIDANDIARFPTADVEEVRHGEWLNEHRRDGKWYHTCSQCETELLVTFYDKRCPNCGAKMDGKKGDKNESV